MIPKIIHQIYWDFSGNNNPPPKDWLRFSKNIRNNHKNWGYKLWNDKSCFNLINNHYPWFLNTYNGYKYPIQKADAIRPFILYHYGGIYIDMDFTCVKNIDNFFNKKGVYILESSHYGLTNAFMASSKNHPFWKNVMEELMKNNKKKIYQTYHIYIMQSTGPYLITQSFKKYKNNDTYIIPKNLFNPCNVCSNNCKQNKNTYCYTRNSSSWHKLDSKIFNYIYCYSKIIFLSFIIIFIFYIVNKYQFISISQ